VSTKVGCAVTRLSRYGALVKVVMVKMGFLDSPRSN